MIGGYSQWEDFWRRAGGMLLHMGVVHAPLCS